MAAKKKAAKASRKTPAASKKTKNPQPGLRAEKAKPRKLDTKAGEHPHTNRVNPEGMQVLGPTETPSAAGLEAHRKLDDVPQAGSAATMPTATGGPPEKDVNV